MTLIKPKLGYNRYWLGLGKHYTSGTKKNYLVSYLHNRRVMSEAMI